MYFLIDYIKRSLHWVNCIGTQIDLKYIALLNIECDVFFFKVKKKWINLSLYVL